MALQDWVIDRGLQGEISWQRALWASVQTIWTDNKREKKALEGDHGSKGFAVAVVEQGDCKLGYEFLAFLLKTWNMLSLQ